MNIEQAKKLLEQEGYRIVNPIGKKELLSVMEQLHSWYDEEIGLDLSQQECIDIIIKLIEEHTK